MEKVEGPNNLPSERIFDLKLDEKRRLYFLPTEWLAYENTGQKKWHIVKNTGVVLIHYDLQFWSWHVNKLLYLCHIGQFS